MASTASATKSTGTIGTRPPSMPSSGIHFWMRWLIFWIALKK